MIILIQTVKYHNNLQNKTEIKMEMIELIDFREFDCIIGRE